jgi:hypothetical protein
MKSKNSKIQQKSAKTMAKKPTRGEKKVHPEAFKG